MRGTMAFGLWLVTQLCLTSPLWAQAPKKASLPGPVSEKAVREAIRRGIEYLRATQTEEGYWVFEREVRDPKRPQQTPVMREDRNYNLGLTALAALALMANGVPPSDPVVGRACDYVRKHAANEERTYSLALTILLLGRLGARQDRPLAKRLAIRLMLGQLDSGGWTYTCPRNPSRESKRRPLLGHEPREGLGDNSNTQFGVLGLWAASRLGVDVRQAMKLVERRFRETQASSGGWNYKPDQTGDRNSMTTAGLYVLTVVTAAMRRYSQGKPEGRRAARTAKQKKAAAAAPAAPPSIMAILGKDEAFQKALSRAAQFAAGINTRSTPYYLWSLERLGVTLQVGRIGKVDWYAKGAQALLKNQSESGAWEIAHKGVADTAFCLLFLRKANLTRDIAYVLSGDARKPFIVFGKKKPQAYLSLPEAIKAAERGAVIQIMGQGPYELAGLSLVQKDLTIRAVEGFHPVLVHRLKLLDDPVLYPRFQSVFAVQGCQVTLEGLHIQADPYHSARPPWAAVSVQDGLLRVLNCSFTQTNRQKVSGVRLQGQAAAELRNCLFAGFASAIECQPKRQQQVTLENCMIYSRVGLRARSPSRTATSSLAVTMANNTLHVGEVFQMGSMYGPVQFSAEGNIFHASSCTTQLRPRDANSPRSWQGKHNLFDLARWLGVSGRLLTDVRDLDGWRRFWETDEEGSGTRSAPFAIYHGLGPFRHDCNPMDWSLTTEEVLEEAGPHVQVGCDPYLVGAGDAYDHFLESAAYEQWAGTAAVDKESGSG